MIQRQNITHRSSASNSGSLQVVIVGADMVDPVIDHLAKIVRRRLAGAGKSQPRLHIGNATNNMIFEATSEKGTPNAMICNASANSRKIMREKGGKLTSMTLFFGFKRPEKKQQLIRAA